MWNKYILVILLLSLGALSIDMKMFESKNIEWSHKQEVKHLTQYLRIRDLALSNKFRLNNEGSFTAYVYRYNDCNGGWLITPMYRNSEAVSLFTRRAVYKNYKVEPVFYMLNEVLYDEFPDLDLWILQKMNAVKNMVGLSRNGSLPVFAIRGFGACMETHAREELL